MTCVLGSEDDIEEVLISMAVEEIGREKSARQRTTRVGRERMKLPVSFLGG